METLVLALGLGMVGTAVADLDSKTHQPYREDGVRPSTGVAPRRTVVHQHRKRQSVATKQRGQAAADRQVLLIVARLDAQRITGVIVEYGERMTAALRHREMTFEVHLPQ